MDAEFSVRFCSLRLRYPGKKNDGSVPVRHPAGHGVVWARLNLTHCAERRAQRRLLEHVCTWRRSFNPPGLKTLPNLDELTFAVPICHPWRGEAISRAILICAADSPYVWGRLKWNALSYNISMR